MALTHEPGVHPTGAHTLMYTLPMHILEFVECGVMVNAINVEMTLWCDAVLMEPGLQTMYMGCQVR